MTVSHENEWGLELFRPKFLAALPLRFSAYLWLLQRAQKRSLCRLGMSLWWLLWLFFLFRKKGPLTSRPLQIQIEKNLIELFLQQIVKWSPQALKNWYKLYLQILHVNEVFTNGNFFCATSERHPSHNTFMSKEPIFKFSNDNHSQLTILKYQQLQTNVFPKKLSWGTNPSPRRE